MLINLTFLPIVLREFFEKMQHLSTLTCVVYKKRDNNSNRSKFLDYAKPTSVILVDWLVCLFLETTSYLRRFSCLMTNSWAVCLTFFLFHKTTPELPYVSLPLAVGTMCSWKQLQWVNVGSWCLDWFSGLISLNGKWIRSNCFYSTIPSWPNPTSRPLMDLEGRSLWRIYCMCIFACKQEKWRQQNERQKLSPHKE